METTALATIESALARYNLGAIESIAPVGGEHENAPHVVTTGNGKYFAKWLTPRLSAMPALEARHRFVDHLVKAKVRVPRLIRTRNGAGCVGEGPCAVEVYEYIEGRPMGPDDGARVVRAGVLLHELHEAAESFRSPTPGMRRDWLTADGDLAKLDAVRKQMETYVPAPEMFEPLEYVKRMLSELAKALSEVDLPTQMIHGSFSPDNVVLSGGKVWATDFDYCHGAPRVYDVASAALHGEFIAGYDGMTEDEVAALPAAKRRVLIHLRLSGGASPERVAEELGKLEG